MAEIELSVPAGQCLNHRIAKVADLRREVAVWQDEWNADAGRVQGWFTTADARIKLRLLYPPT